MVGNFLLIPYTVILMDMDKDGAAILNIQDYNYHKLIIIKFRGQTQKLQGRRSSGKVKLKTPKLELKIMPIAVTDYTWKESELDLTIIIIIIIIMISQYTNKSDIR